MSDDSSARSTAESRKESRSTPVFSRPWMAAYLDDALEMGLLRAAKKHELTLRDLRHFEERDPAFAQGLACIRDLQDQQLVDTLRESAAEGNTRAANLYLRQREKLRNEQRHRSSQTGRMEASSLDGLPSAVAEAMIAAGLRAADRLEGLDPEPPRYRPWECPCCGYVWPLVSGTRNAQGVMHELYIPSRPRPVSTAAVVAVLEAAATLPYALAAAITRPATTPECPRCGEVTHETEAGYRCGACGNTLSG